MAGVKGQKNDSKHKRSNGWVTGTQEVVRDGRSITFKLKKELGDRAYAEMESEGLSKQSWCDRVIDFYYGDGDSGPQEAAVTHPLVTEAVVDFLEKKRIAIARERKLKKPDQKLIEQWEKEIDELEGFL